MKSIADGQPSSHTEDEVPAVTPFDGEIVIERGPAQIVITHKAALDLAERIKEAVALALAG